MSENGLPRACGPRNDRDGEGYHPCRWCTDKYVCHGECARAAPYINRARRVFAEAMKRKTDCHEAAALAMTKTGEADCHGGGAASQ